MDKDRCELVETKRGWRFRFFKAGKDESMLLSNLVYDTAEECKRVAKMVDVECFTGVFTKRIRTLKRRA